MDFERLAARPETERMLGICVSQGGKKIGEFFREEDCRRNLYSASKSYTSCAVGIAEHEGLLDLSERVVDVFPEEIPAEVNEHLAHATVRDLLTMCLGQDQAYLMGGQRPLIRDRNWARAGLAEPFVYEPNTCFVYNNVGPYLAGLLVQRRAGCDLVHYLTPRLFEPMGIFMPTWETDPMGNTFGAGGLFLTLREFHHFGELYLQGGRWNGKQLVPERWVMESTRKQVENHTPYGYGYLFWGGPEGSFRADGKYGQLSIIIRSKDAVVSVLSESRDVPALQAAIFEEVIEKL